VAGWRLCGRINNWLATIAQKRLSEVRTARVVLRSIFALAFNSDAIPRNPAKETIRLPKPRRTGRVSHTPGDNGTENAPGRANRSHVLTVL
jgi:hypothetical protein